MAVFTLDDAHGELEVVVFPEAFARCGMLIEAGALVLVQGKLEKDEESARLIAADLVPLDRLRERLAREVRIRLTSPPHGRDTLEALAALLASHRGDRRVSLEIEVRRGSRPLRVRAEIAQQICVRPSPQLIAEVEGLCGAGSIVLR
jgi:DNA polymerase-3 subunit alpha